MSRAMNLAGAEYERLRRVQVVKCRTRLFLSVFLGILLAGMSTAHVQAEDPETVAARYLQAAQDGDSTAMARLSVVEEPFPVLKWRRVGAESRRDDQGTIGEFVAEMDAYEEGKDRLLGIVQRHRDLLAKRERVTPANFESQEESLVAERDSLLVELEQIKYRHWGLVHLLEVGALPRILGGRDPGDLTGPYRVEIYDFFAEISSVSLDVVRVQHRMKIELCRLAVGDLGIPWLVYRINDLTE